MLCQVFPEQYQQQLDEKIVRLNALLPPQVAELPQTVFQSDKQHYRARAEFRVWHDEDETDYVMFDQETKEKVKIKVDEACKTIIKKELEHEFKLNQQAVDIMEAQQKLMVDMDSRTPECSQRKEISLDWRIGFYLRFR